MIYVQISPHDVMEQYAPRGSPAAATGSAHPVMRQRSSLLHAIRWRPSFDEPLNLSTTSLTVDSAHYYHGTVRNFLNYLGAQHPRVRSLRQLPPADPHILDWLTLLRSSPASSGQTDLRPLRHSSIAPYPSKNWPGPKGSRS